MTVRSLLWSPCEVMKWKTFISICRWNGKGRFVQLQLQQNITFLECENSTCSEKLSAFKEGKTTSTSYLLCTVITVSVFNRQLSSTYSKPHQKFPNEQPKQKFPPMCGSSNGLYDVERCQKAWPAMFNIRQWSANNFKAKYLDLLWIKIMRL